MGSVHVPLSHSWALQQQESLEWVRKMNTSTFISVIMAAQNISNRLITLSIFTLLKSHLWMFFLSFNDRKNVFITNVTHWKLKRRRPERQVIPMSRWQWRRCQLLTVSPPPPPADTSVGAVGQRSESDSAVQRVSWWTSSSGKVKGDAKKKTISGSLSSTGSLYLFWRWMHFHHFILFNNSQMLNVIFTTSNQLHLYILMSQ